MRYTTILFDLDGTLTDSAPGIFNGFRYALHEMGKPEPTLDQLRQCVGPPLWDSFAGLFGLTGPLTDEAVVQFRVYYEKTGIFENSVYPGVRELLAALRSAGCALVLASAKKEESVLRVADHFDLSQYFDFIAGSDERIGRVDKRAVIGHALGAMAVQDKARALMVGDRCHDIEGAVFYRLPSAGVLWGYGSREELTAAGATHLAETPEDLARLILS